MLGQTEDNAIAACIMQLHQRMQDQGNPKASSTLAKTKGTPFLSEERILSRLIRLIRLMFGRVARGWPLVLSHGSLAKCRSWAIDA